jgi:hypothetical protein
MYHYYTYEELEDTIDDLDDLVADLDEIIFLARIKINGLLNDRERIWQEAYEKGKNKKPDAPDERNPFA